MAALFSMAIDYFLPSSLKKRTKPPKRDVYESGIVVASAATSDQSVGYLSVLSTEYGLGTSSGAFPNLHSGVIFEGASITSVRHFKDLTVCLGCTDRRIRLFDLFENRVLVSSSPHSVDCTTTCTLPSSCVVAASDHNDINIYRVEETDDKKTLLHLTSRFQGHDSRVVSLFAAEDIPSWSGRFLSGCCSPRRPAVLIWDIEKGREGLTLEGHTQRITSIAVSPDGVRVATGSLDGTVRLWDPRDPRHPEVIRLDEPVHSVMWSSLNPNPDRNLLVVCCEETLCRYDPKKVLETEYIAPAQQGPCLNKCAEIDAERFVTCSPEGGLAFWNTLARARLSHFRDDVLRPNDLCCIPRIGCSRFGEYLLDRAYVGKGERVGKGSQGEVYRGVMRIGLQGMPVAIKQICIATRRRAVVAEEEEEEEGVHHHIRKPKPNPIAIMQKKELQDEIAKMALLKHKNINKCFGCFYKEEFEIEGVDYVASIVFQWCDASMKDWLFSPKLGRLTPDQRLDVLHQIALGMEHVAGQKIVHGDLNPDNVLIRHSARGRGVPVMKITDFGLASWFDSDLGLTGKPTYMAPRNPPGSFHPSSGDVYSYGIMCWEVWTQRKAFHRLKDRFMHRPQNELFDAIHDPSVDPPNRPNLDCEKCQDMPDSLKSLVQSCWSADPDERPTFKTIVKCLWRLMHPDLDDDSSDEPDPTDVLLSAESEQWILETISAAFVVARTRRGEGCDENDESIRRLKALHGYVDGHIVLSGAGSEQQEEEEGEVEEEEEEANETHSAEG